MVKPFRLYPKTPGLLPSPSKMHISEQEAIQALRFLAAELTLGLLFLHRHGIVHQDIKPANVMISEGGHAVIGEFSAASALPVLVQTSDNPLKRPCPPSVADEGGMTYGSIVLQPEDTLFFTPLYAAPELLERKKNGLLIYDERADWWSLGISLYEITTGGTPFPISSDAVSIGERQRENDETGLFFDLLEGLDLSGADVPLDGYLRSVNFFVVLASYKDSHDNIASQLLVHDPSHRLSGEKAKSHPFLEPLQDIWTEIEDLKHPPCPKPFVRILYRDTDVSFDDLQDDSSKFDAECTRISYSRRTLELPQTPHEEYYTAHEVFSSPEQNSLESPFLTRRREALAVKQPEGQLNLNDHNAIDSNRLQESESSVILQPEAFMSYYIETSFRTNGSLSVVNALPSTGSAGRFFLEENSYGTCTMQRPGAFPENEDSDIVRAETSFTDSGLDFPLGCSPESWGHRKVDSFKQPLALRPMCEQRFQELELAKDRGGRIHDEIPTKLEGKKTDFPLAGSGLVWTFDERITISLLQASLKEREKSEPTVRSRLSKPQLVAAASERIFKAAGRRLADVLRRRRQ